tara:strand:+ start:138 stop:611 length:474 start_codon:yes stop_codon:yes gene_type:complete
MLLKINERERCPKEIKDDFNGNRMAPEAYIAFHRRLAENELTAVCSFSEAKIHNEWMEGDGWGDGFKTLHAVIETVAGRLLKIKYHDGNQAFMRKCGGGGWASMSPQDLDNPDFTNIMKRTRAMDEKKESAYFKNLFEDIKKEKTQDEHDELFDKYF